MLGFSCVSCFFYFMLLPRAYMAVSESQDSGSFWFHVIPRDRPQHMIRVTVDTARGIVVDSDVVMYRSGSSWFWKTNLHLSICFPSRGKWGIAYLWTTPDSRPIRTFPLLAQMAHMGSVVTLFIIISYMFTYSTLQGWTQKWRARLIDWTM